MSVRKTLLALAVPAVLTACVETPKAFNTQIPMASRDKIASTEVVVPVLQNEIQNYQPPATPGGYVPTYYSPTVSPGAAAAGGIIAALIIAGVESAAQATAEAEIKPLKASLSDFNFDQTLQAEVKTALANAAFLHAGEPRVIKDVTTKNLDGVVTGTSAAAVLSVRSDYSLSPNADEVLVSIYPMFYPATADLKATLPEKPTKSGGPTQAANALYRNTLAFRTQVPGATSDRNTNISLWTADKGAAMRAALSQGATKLAQMLVADMSAEPYAPIDAKTTKLASFKEGISSGYVLRADEEGGQVIGFTSGAQTYVTKAALEPLVQATAEQKAQASQAVKAANPATVKKSARERAAEEKAAKKAKRSAGKKD